MITTVMSQVQYVQHAAEANTLSVNDQERP